MAAAAMLLAGCGGPPPGTGHDSPDHAVAGLVDRLHSGDQGGINDWLAPSDRRAFQDLLAFNQRSGLTLTLRAPNVHVGAIRYRTPDRADVAYTGDIGACASGTLPSPDPQKVDDCAPIRGDSNHHGTLQCVRENGAWYVFLNIGSGGKLGGDLTPPPVPAGG